MIHIKRWLIYTVTVALLPIISRLLVYHICIHKESSVWISSLDIIFFALTLNISNINEITVLTTHDSDNNINQNKNIFVGISVIFIFFLSILLGCNYIDEMVEPIILNRFGIFIASISLAVFSLFYSFNIVRNAVKE